jgi:Pentapeptide repeats (8 copies)
LHVLKHWLAWPRAIRLLLGGIAAAALVLAVAWSLLLPAADWLAHHDVSSAEGPRLQTARGQLLALVAVLFAAGALVFSARTFTLARRTVELTGQRHATGRYATAIEQLGSDKLDVRIGGIYALERIARDSAKDHPTVMEVLTAFIREHSRDQWPPSHGHGRKKMRPDLQAALTVMGRRDAQRDIQRLDLTAADLSSASLTGANLAGAQLAFADLSCTYLSNATFSGGCLLGANLHSASIGGADFTGADLTGADFTFALAAADLNGANFAGARLDGARWPENVPVPGGWKLDAGSGRLKAAGTESGPAQADRRAISRPKALSPARLNEPGFGYWPHARDAAGRARGQLAETARAAAAPRRQGTDRRHLAHGRDHVLGG